MLRLHTYITYIRATYIHHIYPYVAKNLLKNLANRTSRGKNFGGVFLDVFCYPEFESAIRIALFSPDHEILNWWCLLVRDCTILTIPICRDVEMAKYPLA